MRIWTIGHSTLNQAGFADPLVAHDINVLVDVRSYPGSRRCPWFGKDQMPRWLPCDYVHMPELGGRRGKQPVDPNINAGWQNLSFKHYADWMQTPGFDYGLRQLEALAVEVNVAFMCSEAVPWRCHRSLISDALVARGWTVHHIGIDRDHVLGGWGAQPTVNDGHVTYRSGQLALLGGIESLEPAPWVDERFVAVMRAMLDPQ